MSVGNDDTRLFRDRLKLEKRSAWCAVFVPNYPYVNYLPAAFVFFFQLVARLTRETDLYSRNGGTRTNCFFVASRQHEIEGIIGVRKVISFTTAPLTDPFTHVSTYFGHLLLPIPIERNTYPFLRLSVLIEGQNRLTTSVGPGAICLRSRRKRGWPSGE